MIFKSFLLVNIVSCRHSDIVIGLYYGFMTTFSIGSSYLSLLQSQVMEEVIEKKVSASTGFIMGQLMMLLSIYYSPMHLALGRPHAITVLVLPYFLLHFFWHNNKNLGSTTINSMRNFNIQCVFLNNLIFPLFNHFILPSSILARLVNIYMFRCNNKMIFVTSSFIGWLVGHILFMKWLGLVLVWIRQNNSIRFKKYIKFNKYLVSELRIYMARILSILLFITCVYYLGRIPSPILTKKLKEISKTEERVENDVERNVEMETASEIKGIKQEQEGSIEEDPSTSVFSEKREKEDSDKIYETEEIRSPVSEDSCLNLNGNQQNSKYDKKNPFWFEKPIVTLLFDYNRWNRPFRYIKNNRFEKVVINEMSQYFFETCQSDGKQRISFTYPPSLSNFLEKIKKNIFVLTLEKKTSDELENCWVYSNKEKSNNLNKEFINRIEGLDRKPFCLDIIETRTRLCNDDTKNKYLPKIYDPFLNGPYRGTIKKKFLPSIRTPIENFKNRVGINRIHNILLPYTNYKELVNAILTDPNNRKKKENLVVIKEISKKVPCRSYKLITELEQQLGEYQEDIPWDHQIRSRKAKRMVVFTVNKQDTDPNTKDINPTDQIDEVALIHYSQQSDFRRDIIKGSIRAQRRKTVIWKLFQTNVHSFFFFDRIMKYPLLFFDISQLTNFIYQNWKRKKIEVKIGEPIEEQTKREEEEKKKENKRKEKARIEVAEAWDSIPFAQGIRSSMLLTQSILRKYILLPFLIMSKNIGRMLLFQPPEWSEDLEEWNREMHVKCTYNGVQLSEREFPKNWFTDGIQIKILFPFRLKPWHRSKLRSSHRDRIKKKKQKKYFSFLTVFGMEAALPFGSPLKRPSFLKPIIRELKKKIVKLKKKSFLDLRVLKVKIKGLPKVNPIILLNLRKVYESNETQKEKDYKIINLIINESFSQIQYPDWTNFSLIEKKNKDLTDRISIIRNQIERITKEKNKVTPTKNISFNKRSYNAKRLDFKKKICQILKRRNPRLTYKLHYFIKFLIESMYIDFFLSILYIPRINTKLFLELRIFFFENVFINNEPNKKKINKEKKNRSLFVSNIKKSLDNISKKYSNIYSNFGNLSSLSQAYVFYKLLQTQVVNLYKYRLVLQYRGTSFFLKTEIKDFFGRLGIFQPELKHNKLKNRGMNQWKNCLIGQYPYNLSQIRWSRLIPKKWRNIIYEFIKNKDLNKWDSYEKNQLINYKNKSDFEVHSLWNQRNNFLKYYRYDLFSYKSLNPEDSPIYGSKFEKKKNQDISSNYNTYKKKLFDILNKDNMAIKTYLGRDLFFFSEKIFDRKYLDWKILNLDLRQKVDIEDWIKIDTKRNKTTHSYQIIDKIDKKDFFYINVYQDKKINSTNHKKRFFDWMEMNEDILNCPVSNLEIWFFPEFIRLYNVYKTKPWVIPSKFLLLNCKKKKNVGENKNINGKERVNFFIRWYKKINHRNKEEPVDQGDLGSNVQNKGNFGSIKVNPQKNFEEDFVVLDMKKEKKKKQYKRNTEAELDIFLKRYFLFQLRWDDSLNQRIINNIQVYCFLLRLKNIRNINISSIQRREINLDIMLIDKNLTLTKLMEKSVLIIEPLRLSVKNDGQFIMYQTIGIYLVQKSKHKKINEKFLEQKYNTHFDESISKYKKTNGNRYKNHLNVIVPEKIFSSGRRRELRILICFNSKNEKCVNLNTVFYKGREVKNCNPFFGKSIDPDKDKNELIKLEFFFLPNYQLEDLACMNRFWFDTNNGSCFSMLRIHMYPLLKIH
uniref:Protein TIC 214 n=1 Tax=Lennoa madreporoides TaxID=111108 RepID=A0A385GMX9_9ASTE|nr:hypothetical protein [Lennoa madreporoides]AXX76008.1 hypothetical protein [Lennoa madreporoides]